MKPESVEGEAEGEAVTLWKCEGCGHWVDSIFVKEPDDPEQTACPVCCSPDLPDEPPLVTFVPESSLNAALARAEEAERERDKLEALAAGQAATIEGIRKLCEGVQRSEYAEPSELNLADAALDLLNPKESE